MSFLEAILTDLREKRLWPVVAALVAGIVVLPLVISHAVTAPAPSGPQAGPRTSLVTGSVRRLVDASVPTAGAVHVRGPLRDPFQVPKAPSGATGATGAVGARTTTTAGTTGTTGGSTNPTTKPKKLGTVYAITLAFGQATRLKHITAPIRLSPFPDPAAPQIAYIGVRKGGKSALFLVNKGAVASGDGRCLPSASNCQIVELKPAQVEFFDVTGTGTGLVQYELDMGTITFRHTQTRSAAIYVNRLVSEAGKEFAASVHSTELPKLAIDLVNGVIVPAAPAPTKGVVPGTSTLKAAGGAPVGKRSTASAASPGNR